MSRLGIGLDWIGRFCVVSIMLTTYIFLGFLILPGILRKSFDGLFMRLSVNHLHEEGSKECRFGRCRNEDFLSRLLPESDGNAEK